MNSAAEVFLVLVFVYGFYGLAFLVVYLLGRRKVYPGQVIRKETLSGVQEPSMIMGTPYVNAGSSLETSIVNSMESAVSKLGRSTAYQGHVLRKETLGPSVSMGTPYVNAGSSMGSVNPMHSTGVKQQQPEVTDVPQDAPPAYQETPISVQAPSMSMRTHYVIAGPSMGTSIVNSMESAVSLLGRRKAYPGQVLSKATLGPSMSMGAPYVNAEPTMGTPIVKPMHSAGVTPQQPETTNASQEAPPVYQETLNGVQTPSMSMGTPNVNAVPSMGTPFVNPMHSVGVEQQQQEATNAPQGALPVYQEKLAH